MYIVYKGFSRIDGKSAIFFFIVKWPPFKNIPCCPSPTQLSSC